MHTRINYLGFLSLLALLGFLGPLTGNLAFYGFFGFLAYLCYFYVMPDELFIANVKKACTVTYLAQLTALAPLAFAIYLFRPTQVAFVAAMTLCFAFGLLFFSVYLVYLEHKERQY